MAVLKDLSDKTVRLAIAYGKHAVRGTRIKRDIRITGTNLDIYTQQALGEGPWNQMLSLFYDAHVIAPAQTIFHKGLGDDASDANFPTDDPHPWTASYSTHIPPEINADEGTVDDPDNMFGIFETLLTGDFNEDGDQIDGAGSVVTPAEIREEFIYKPNPANVAADQILRWTRPFESTVSVTDWINSRKSLIDWPSWVAWRDYNWEMITDTTTDPDREIHRFECHVFFIPPYDLADALDRICQISCADWQWANGKIRFLTPEYRPPVFTINQAESNTFKTFPVDRRQRPNQIIINFRDLDNEYLDWADPPVIIPSESAAADHKWKVLQQKDGKIRPFIIDGGCMTRSQAQRMGTFWARTLMDMDQMASLTASPKTYHVLSADTVLVTHEIPDWEDIEFKVVKKEEVVRGKLGDDLLMQLYGPGLYSDTDQEPLVRPLPSNRPDPFTAPLVVTSVTLTELGKALPDGTFTPTIQGAVQFAPFIAGQRGRVWINYPGDDPAEYTRTDIILTPEPSTLLAGFDIPTAVSGIHTIRVVSESQFGVSLDFGDHTTEAIDVVGLPPLPPTPTTLIKLTDVDGNVLYKWLKGLGAPKRGEDDEIFLFEILTAGGEVKRDAKIQIYLSEPCIWTRIALGSAANCNTVSVIKGDGTLTHTGDSVGACYFESQRFNNDSFVEFEVGSKYPPFQFAVVGAATPITFTVNPTTDLITTSAPHEFGNGDVVKESSTVTPPSGMGPLAVHYIRDVTITTFKLALTPGGPAIDFTDEGTGVHTIEPGGVGIYFEMVQYGGKYYLRPEQLSVDPVIRVPGAVRIPLPTDRYAISIVSGHARYFYNWHGHESIPMWTSGQYRLPKWFKIIATLGFLNGEAQEALRCRAFTTNPREFRYTVDMQKKDNVGSLSPVNRIRIRQYSSLLDAYGPALDVTL